MDTGKLSRIRAQIRAGDYETEAKLRAVVDRLVPLILDSGALQDHVSNPMLPRGLGNGRVPTVGLFVYGDGTISGPGLRFYPAGDDRALLDHCDGGVVWVGLGSLI